MNFNIIKKHFLVLILLLISKLSISQVNRTEIIISKSSELNDTVYLVKGRNPSFEKSKWEIIDSSIFLSSAKFIIKSKVPEYYRIFFGTKISKPIIVGFNEKIFLSATDKSLSFSSIKGSYENSLLNNLNKLDGLLFNKMNSYADSADFFSSDSLKYNYFAKKNQDVANEIRQMHVRFIEKNPESFVALSYLTGYIDSFSSKKINNIIKSYKFNTTKNEYIIDLNKKLIDRKILAEAKTFFDFNYKDTLEKSFSFSKIKSKFILIDFWASWCVPCLKNITFLDSSLRKYDNQLITKFAFSFDTNTDNWKKGVKLYSKDWTHLSDLNGFEGNVAKFYNISSIPRYILFDENKRIINNNLDIMNIEAILEKYLSSIAK